MQDVLARLVKELRGKDRRRKKERVSVPTWSPDGLW